MTIKAFAFSAQQRVAERCGISLQRSHVYESLAAAFGFASYASLCVDQAFDIRPPGRFDVAGMADSVTQRLIQLGLSDSVSRQVASELTALVSDQGLRAVGIDQIIDSFLPIIYAQGASEEIEDDSDEGYEEVEDSDERDNEAPAEGFDHLLENWEVSTFLRSGLEEAAKRGNPKAHYALALILEPEGDLPVGSSYWHDRQVLGDQLSGVQLEWANGHRAAEEQEATRLHHLLEAARLGHPDACVDAAEEFEDPAFLKAIGRAALRDPFRASEIAAELGQVNLAADWCAMAAQRGDIEAVRQMIEIFDRGDLLRCWTWLHFARGLGTDLTRDDYRLVYEDGSRYDDDVGGPGFPVGVRGINLPVLEMQQEAHALSEARAMAQRLKNGTGAKAP